MTSEASFETEDEAGETLDVFHRGAFHLIQPALKGHRSGVDAMILASSVPNGFAGRVADLGSGAGAAGLAVASRCPDANITLVERSAFMAGFARRSVAHPLNAALAGRISVIEADVGLRGKARIAAGLVDKQFRLRHHGSALQRSARSQHTRSAEGGSASCRRYVRAMGAHCGGHCEAWRRHCHYCPTGSISSILEALSGRFGGLGIIPVQPRPEAAAIRIVVTGTRGSRAGLSLMPALTFSTAATATASPHAPTASITGSTL